MQIMPKHILVIDDNAELLELFHEILAVEAAYRVSSMTYEPQIVCRVKSLAPDLIICDNVLDDQEVGLDIVQMLKLDSETEDIPVIMCSGAVRQLREMEAYLASRNVGVLYKPFDVDELVNMVERKLEQSEEERAKKARQK